MDDEIANGTAKYIDGKECVYYDGYWIRKYKPPIDEVAARRAEEKWRKYI